jgi:hypothetical protein
MVFLGGRSGTRRVAPSGDLLGCDADSEKGNVASMISRKQTDLLLEARRSMSMSKSMEDDDDAVVEDRLADVVASKSEESEVVLVVVQSMGEEPDDYHHDDIPTVSTSNSKLNSTRFLPSWLAGAKRNAILTRRSGSSVRPSMSIDLLNTTSQENMDGMDEMEHRTEPPNIAMPNVVENHGIIQDTAPTPKVQKKLKKKKKRDRKNPSLPSLEPNVDEVNEQNAVLETQNSNQDELDAKGENMNRQPVDDASASPTSFFSFFPWLTEAATSAGDKNGREGVSDTAHQHASITRNCLEEPQNASLVDVSPSRVALIEISTEATTCDPVSEVKSKKKKKKKKKPVEAEETVQEREAPMDNAHEEERDHDAALPTTGSLDLSQAIQSDQLLNSVISFSDEKTFDEDLDVTVDIARPLSQGLPDDQEVPGAADGSILMVNKTGNSHSASKVVKSILKSDAAIAANPRLSRWADLQTRALKFKKVNSDAGSKGTSTNTSKSGTNTTGTDDDDYTIDSLVFLGEYFKGSLMAMSPFRQAPPSPPTPIEASVMPEPVVAQQENQETSNPTSPFRRLRRKRKDKLKVAQG